MNVCTPTKCGKTGSKELPKQIIRVHEMELETWTKAGTCTHASSSNQAILAIHVIHLPFLSYMGWQREHHSSNRELSQRMGFPLTPANGLHETTALEPLYRGHLWDRAGCPV